MTMISSFASRLIASFTSPTSASAVLVVLVSLAHMSLAQFPFHNGRGPGLGPGPNGPVNFNNFNHNNNNNHNNNFNRGPGGGPGPRSIPNSNFNSNGPIEGLGSGPHPVSAPFQNGANNNGGNGNGVVDPSGVNTNEVVHTDLFIRENAKSHHTNQYEILENAREAPLVIRRGDSIYMAVHLQRLYNPAQDKIRLEFLFGSRPQVNKGTLIYVPVTGNREFTREAGRWDSRVVRVEGNVLTVQVRVPADIAIGVWRMRVSTKQGGSRTIRTYSVNNNIYVLFNPWHKDDLVYMEREDWRREFVLTDVGKIYIGSYTKPKGRRWIYGQFVDAVLPAVMFMLDKTRLDFAARSNPVKVVRAVSAMVNSHDDNGLLVGNWSGNYDLGLAPWQWTGSAPILEQYLRTRGEPVKYGQCWVFAGVTTTVLRALGIPARTTTNFVSAHDTDDSLTVDKFFDKAGESISDVNSDSIWNFHVWSDGWMARPDLPPGYGGWQAVDATPQETSDGLYQTGPASLEAIRRGQTDLPYDAAFVFAEVNADVVHWMLDESNDLGWKKIKTNRYQRIVSKMPGRLDDSNGGMGDAVDIYDQYKEREGTDKERSAVHNAARCQGLTFLFELPTRRR